MALPEPLRKKLACPKCHQPLEYIEAEDRLVCGQCRLAFRVVDDIPVLVLDEAEELD
jgi:uncharacterized protein YbaR (Trm112 family)